MLDQAKHEPEQKKHADERGHVHGEVHKAMPVKSWLVSKRPCVLGIFSADGLPSVHFLSPSVPRNIDRPTGVGNG